MGSPDRVFVGAARFAPDAPAAHKGGLFRLAAGDDQWESLSKGLPESPQVQAVLIHPDEPDMVFAGTSVGPYRSTDGGDTWNEVGFDGYGLPVWSFAVHPTDHSTMYLGVGPATVHRSTDCGETWQVLPNAQLTNRVEMGFPTRLISLAPDPSAPDVLFAGVEVGGVMRSDDGGETWTDCTEGLVGLAEQVHLRSRIGSDTEIEGMLDTHALVVSAAAPGRPFLAVRMGLFSSADGGETWTDLDISRFSPLTYCRDVKVSPHDPRTLYGCFSDEALGKDGSLYRSDDLGESWRRYDKVTPQSTMMKVAPHPTDPDQVWCATRRGDVYGTCDGGATWTELPLPAGGRDVYGLTCG